MMKKRWILIFFGILIYAMLLAALVVAESTYYAAGREAAAKQGQKEQQEVSEENDSIINTPLEAIWYSVTTLTTVGYGDLYPISPVGKVIGLIFMLLSLGLLAFLVAVFLVRARTRYLPRIMLFIFRGKSWYIFEGYTPESAAIAGNLKKEYPECLTLFFGEEDSKVGEVPEGTMVVFTAEELLRFHKKNKNSGQQHASENQKSMVFYITGNGAENYSQALSLSDKECSIFCMTEYAPARLPKNLTLFNPYQCCARLYWREHPVLTPGETIVFIGGGKYMRALLEQALTFNIYAPGQEIRYVVYGEATSFRDAHPLLSEELSAGADGFLGDQLLFPKTPWRADLDILRRAQRIILCEDDAEKALDQLCDLQRFCPISGEIHVRTSLSLPDIVSFGKVDEIFRPELVLRQELNRMAILLHENYCKNNPKAGCLPWEELDSYTQHSNFAAADHMDVKARILLGEQASRLKGRDKYRKAYEVYLDRRKENTEIFRHLEHSRWMRLQLLYNWTYAPKRDKTKRYHELMLPYEKLSPKDKEKNDTYWLSLNDVY